ncbi:MAG: branched-chain amino acid ABC transporter permease [Bacillota bacterium]
MDLALQYIVNGITAGSLYALVALGIVLLYRISRVLNFAHGDMAALGTLVAYTLVAEVGLPFGAGAAAGVAAAAALAALFYLSVLRHAREASPLGQSVMTLGLALLLSGAAVVIWGTDIKAMPFPLSAARVYGVGPVVASELHIGSTLAAGLLMAALYWAVERSPWGLAMRAISQDPVAARLLGVRSRRVLAAGWALSAALGAVAGLLLAPVTLLDPFFMLNPFLKGFAAAVMGGLDSPPGAVVGGVVLGVLESLLAGYASVAFKSTLAFALIVLVLMVRPEGLLRREFKRRV